VISAPRGELETSEPGSELLPEKKAAANAPASEQRGLVLVTGPTGTGKTTTIAAMIGWIDVFPRSSRGRCASPWPPA
jgi:Tfp pilus assembly ATPase PilU